MKGKSPIENQAEKIFKHVRAGSYGTRDKYRGICRDATKFLSEKFKMKNLRNLQDKHVVAYAKHLQERGLAPKTIKDRLGAIRYLHNHIPQAKHELSENKELQAKYEGFKLEKVQVIKGNRAWMKEEYQNMQQLAHQIANSKNDLEQARTAKDFKDISVLARTMGFRVAEATLSSRAQAEQALRSGTYHIGTEAKNGKKREVPLSKEARQMFERKIQETPRGGRLFVQKTEQSHQAINRIEKFLGHHRSKVETQEGRQLRTWTNRHQGQEHVNELTMHGMRYNYIQDRVQQEIDKGFNVKQAAQIVTKEVGHERHDVIYIYLGGK